MREAKYWKLRADGRIVCLLCPHFCKLAGSEVGLCNARRRNADKLYSLNYGQATSIAMDPIEKKPLYHFHPGSHILSIGTFGCSFKCPFCQNADISQGRPAAREIAPEEVIRAAQEHGSVGVAYTYNEPMTWMEFMLETAALARARGLKNVAVSNGFVNPGPLKDFLPLLDAANIDVKSMEESFYARLCGAKLRPVLDTCIRMKRAGVHLEITNLVIPGENDTDANFSKLRDWLCDNLGADTPLHLSAYFPHYRFAAPPTPCETLERARAIASERLRYVYLGNVHGAAGSDTTCASCGRVLVRRRGYSIDVCGLRAAACASCGLPVPFVI